MGSPDQMLGKVISHYRILSALGQGGMGIVYKAEDIRLGRTVALKFVPDRMTGNNFVLERFHREARAASALNHPNICTLHDIGEYDTRPYLVMEYLEGRTLAEHLRAGPIHLDDLIEYSIQISDALDAAHSKGIMHRDLKPGNIFLLMRGEIKIMDFGLAKVAAGIGKSAGPQNSQMSTAMMDDLVTSPGSTLGTVAYMSPEQASGQELDCRTDLFSFGVVLYEMAAGASPFHGNTSALTFSAILHGDPIPPGRIRADLPAEMERVILKALEKNRDLRYQSAAEIRADLRRLQRDSSLRGGIAETLILPYTPATPPESASIHISQGHNISGPASSQTIVAAPPVSSAEYIAAGIKRNRRAAIAIAGLLALLAAGILYCAFRPKPLDSLAVLPFTNIGGDPNAEYLSDGIAESIINSLSQLPKLEVRSFSSTERYKNKTLSPDEAGRQLKVRAVLTGRLVRRGDDFAISTELVEVDRNRQLWGAQYEVKAADLLATQERISREISEKLRLELNGTEIERINKHTTEDAEAYQSYLQGRFQWNKRTLEGLQESIQYFQQAIQKDPTIRSGLRRRSGCIRAPGRF